MRNYYYPCTIVFLLLVLLKANPLQAQDCSEVVIPSLPFSESATTCGFGSDLDWDNVCFLWAVNAEDIIYSFTTTNEECLNIEVSGFPAGAAQMMITEGCPMDANSICSSTVFSNWDATSMSALFMPAANTTYYLTITTDDWIAPCTDFALNINSQCPPATTGDCAGAQVICDGFYAEEFGPADNGNYPDMLPTNGCLMSNVANEGWYTLTVQESGMLNFTLTPNETEDYDWALFNITDASCAQIASNPDLLVSCNTYGLIGVNGPTGISSAEGGSGNANGPGDLEGPPFNADLPVQAGETYVLLVSNWTATTNGYQLDFGASTAQFYDEQLPELTDAYADCTGLHVVFSENMDCATALPANFSCTGPNGTVTATAVSSPCEAGAAYSQSFTVTFPVDFTLPGNYSVVFGANGLADMCGNLLEPTEMDFEPANGLQLSAQAFPASCGNTNGSVEVSVIGGGQGPFQFTLNGQPAQDNGVFENLAPGIYSITVTDQNGCSASAEAEVVLETAEFTAGVDAYTCQLFFQTQATTPAGFSGSWQLPQGLSAADANDATTTITATSAGTYQLVWIVTNNLNCQVQDAVTVTFESVNAQISVLTPVSCYGACDGTAQISVGGVINPTGVTSNWSGGNSTANEPFFASDICAGTHSVIVTSENGCSTTLPFIMTEPEPLENGEVSVIPETCPDACDAQLELGSGASAYSINGGQSFSSQRIYTNLCPGNYQLVFRGPTGCTADTTVTLLPADGPEANFKAVEQEVSSYDGVFKFFNQSKGHTGSSWEFGFPDAFLFSELEEPIFQLPRPEPGRYGVLLVVNDDKNCLDSLVQYVKVFEEERVFIPNSFTPNEDGINDLFLPVLANIDPAQYHMQIFNRWGKLLFETHIPAEGWNGSDREGGFYVPNGVYHYRIRYKPDYQEDPKIIRGSVTVVR